MKNAQSIFPVLLVLMKLTHAQDYSKRLDYNDTKWTQRGGKCSHPKKTGKGCYKGTKKARYPVQLGVRPYFLVNSMEDGKLKDKLSECSKDIYYFEKSDWSIGHRGAPLMFPEHTIESYEAALIQGAGIVECDVTFTKDRQLICRHAWCDLHTTTDVLYHPEMNDKWTIPWAKCFVSDFTLSEIKTLCAWVGDAPYQTSLYAMECPRIATHKESIKLIKKYGAKFIPELKMPEVEMPYEGKYTQEDYAQQLIDEYIKANVDPQVVWPQSFNWNDAMYWVRNTDFKQAIALEGNFTNYYLTRREFSYLVKDIKASGVRYFAPPMSMLLDLKRKIITASKYARYIKKNGFNIITWTLERSGTMVDGGGMYYQTVTDAIKKSGDTFVALETLAKDVGIVGIFSDWPATTTFFANCMGL